MRSCCKNHGYYWETYALQNDLPDGRRLQSLMARNKFDVDETLESPFQWKHLKRAFQYIRPPPLPDDAARWR